MCLLPHSLATPSPTLVYSSTRSAVAHRSVQRRVQLLHEQQNRVTNRFGPAVAAAPTQGEASAGSGTRGAVADRGPGRDHRGHDRGSSASVSLVGSLSDRAPHRSSGSALARVRAAAHVRARGPHTPVHTHTVRVGRTVSQSDPVCIAAERSMGHPSCLCATHRRAASSSTLRSTGWSSPRRGRPPYAPPRRRPDGRSRGRSRGRRSNR